MNKQKGYAILLILGASFLLFRTIRLLTIENGWQILANWVIVLTFIEMSIDILCLFFSLKWYIHDTNSSKSWALRLGASAAIFHAFRVLIYVLGKVGPWTNFDLKPAYRENQTVDMFWVYFAAVLSILGVLGVVVIYIKIKNKQHD